MSEPLLLIHGLGADHRVWDPVLPALSERFDVLAIDLPGFGAEPALARGDDPTPERLARFALDAAAARGLERPHLAGNSLGAWVALEAAAAGQARSVTGICPAGLWSRPLLAAGQGTRMATRRLIRLGRPGLLALAGSATGRRALLSSTVSRAAELSPREARHLIDAWLTAPGYAAANLSMRRGRFDHWDSIDVPVTLAWGERDRLVTQPRRPVPARTVTLPGCSHLAMWDDPGLVAETIVDTASLAATPA